MSEKGFKYEGKKTVHICRNALAGHCVGPLATAFLPHAADEEFVEYICRTGPQSQCAYG